ncbi:MAG: hypothetical protein DRP12_01740 [Candidatus Aenigmatarchaeota archaeon]|nr:MAG: hypothetical protein DRP12_01740 [Candidatus Aenigmarchaeota archaeon]
MRKTGGRGFESLRAHMKFGIPLWYGNFRSAGFKQAIQEAKKTGCDYVEVSLDYPVKPQASGIEIAFHAPWAGIETASPFKEIREAAFQVLFESMELASALSPAYYNIHIIAHDPTYHFPEVRKRIKKHAEAAGRRIERKARSLGMRVTIENNPSVFMGTIQDFGFLLKSRLRLCLDIGHVMIANWLLDKPYSLDEWIKRFGKKILTVHFHDCKFLERPYDHLMLGKGDLDLKRIAEDISRTNCEYLLLETIHKLRIREAVSYKDFKAGLKICRKIFGPVV